MLEKKNSSNLVTACIIFYLGIKNTRCTIKMNRHKTRSVRKKKRSSKKSKRSPRYSKNPHRYLGDLQVHFSPDDMTEDIDIIHQCEIINGLDAAQQKRIQHFISKLLKNRDVVHILENHNEVLEQIRTNPMYRDILDGLEKKGIWNWFANTWKQLAAEAVNQATAAATAGIVTQIITEDGDIKLKGKAIDVENTAKQVLNTVKPIFVKKTDPPSSTESIPETTTSTS